MVVESRAPAAGLEELRHWRLPGVEEIVADGKSDVFYAVARQGKRRNLYRCTISGTTSLLRFNVGDNELTGTDSLRRPVFAKRNPLFAVDAKSDKTTGFLDMPFRLLCVKSGLSIGTAPSGEVMTAWNTGSPYEFGDNWKSLGFASGCGPAMAIDVSPLGSTIAATFISRSPLIGSFKLNSKKPDFKTRSIEASNWRVARKSLDNPNGTGEPNNRSCPDRCECPRKSSA